MSTTAEGVESAGQFAALTRLGCTEAQGFYFSPGRPTGEIPHLIETLERSAATLLADAL